MLKVTNLIFNPFEECTYVVADGVSGEAIVVDPGMFNAEECQRFDDFIEDNKLNIKGVVNTHLHLDHCFGIQHIKEKYSVGLSAHPADAPLGESFAEQCQRFGLRRPKSPIVIDTPLADGDSIAIGEEALKVLHVPGHSPGGIALYSESREFALVGDSLFHGSIGRTDLPGGSYPQLIKSIQQSLLTLPDATTVLPGHGDRTTIASERKYNPFL